MNGERRSKFVRRVTAGTFKGHLAVTVSKWRQSDPVEIKNLRVYNLDDTARLLTVGTVKPDITCFVLDEITRDDDSLTCKFFCLCLFTINYRSWFSNGPTSRIGYMLRDNLLKISC